MGRFALSKEEQATMKAKIKTIIVRNECTLTRRQLKERFPRVPDKIFTEINKEMRADPRTPGWVGIPISQYIEGSDMKQHVREKSVVMAEFKARCWRQMKSRKKESGFMERIK